MSLLTKKFKFLTKESIKKKINTKSFKIVNLVLCLIIVAVANLDLIVKMFGGDFEDKINIYVVDEVSVYEGFETIVSSSYFDLVGNYNASVVKSEKTLDELKQKIKDEENSDIIINITKPDNISVSNVFDVEIITYEYIDNLLYQNIINALNTVKRQVSLSIAGIDQTLLNDIYADVEINRVMLNDEIKENEEIARDIGGVIIIIFVVPFFILIIYIVQMIGAEINEEKTSRSMEVIISSVSPETHFLSKLISANVFAVVQGLLLILYAAIGMFVRFKLAPIDLGSLEAGGISTGSINNFISLFLKSDVFSNFLVGLPLFIIIILLSFFAYSLIIGIFASVTTSMEDYNQIQTPIMIFLMIGYYLAIYSSTFEGSTFITFMGYIPFISGILAPVLYVMGQMSMIGLFIASGLLIVTCYLLYKYGMRVYKVGILNYSSSKLWTKMFKSLKKN